MKRLIINVDGTPLRKLLSGEWKASQVLRSLDGEVLKGSRKRRPDAKDPAEQIACWYAKSYLEGTGEHQAYPEVLLVDPEDPANPRTTKLYREEWREETAYAYRLPCGNWLHCENPKGPITVHYASPGKHPKRQGPALCSFCRSKQGPTPLHRETLAKRNHERKDELAEARGAARGERVIPG